MTIIFKLSVWRQADAPLQFSIRPRRHGKALLGGEAPQRAAGAKQHCARAVRSMGAGVEFGMRQIPHTQRAVTLGGSRMATPNYLSFYILGIVLSFPVSVQ